MRKILLGAAGLMLSTSALAAISTTKAMTAPASAPVAAKAADGLGAAMIGNAITIDWPAKAADADKAPDPTKLIEASAKAPPEAPAAQAPSTAMLSDSGKGAEAMTGMGGPEEPADALPPPVRAFSARDYPPCTSRADDHCIQLYEPGVRQSLAAWQATHGANQTGMGGPEEAIDDAVPAKGDESAAYEPLPEDAVMPISSELAKTELPAGGPDAPTAI